MIELFEIYLLKNQPWLLNDAKIKPQTLLTDIGGECYVNPIRNTKPPSKQIGSRNKHEKQYRTEGDMKAEFEHWKDLKIQIHWKNWNI